MRTNVGDIERAISVGVGAIAVTRAVSRGGGLGLLVGALGAALLYRGFSGHCGMYQKLGIDTHKGHHHDAGVASGEGITVEQIITINRPPEEVYRFWRDLHNLPRFMKQLNKVEVRENGESHWEVSGPGGQTLEWDARIIHERPHELIAWESLPGAEVPNAGSVRFESAPGDRGTELKVSLTYTPPLGKLGELGAKLLNRSPEKQLKEDLQRLRQILETGELTTAQ